MLVEIGAAVDFLTSHLASSSLHPSDLEVFRTVLTHILTLSYADHWHPHSPELASAYRAIFRAGPNPTDLDPVILLASSHASIPQQAVADALMSALGERWHLWVDPGCVLLRKSSSTRGGRTYRGGGEEWKEVYGRLPDHVRRKIASTMYPTSIASLLDDLDVDDSNLDNGSTALGVGLPPGLRPPSRAASSSPTKRSRAIKIVRPGLPTGPLTLSTSLPTSTMDDEDMVTPVRLDPPMALAAPAEIAERTRTPSPDIIFSSDPSDEFDNTVVLPSLLPAAELAEPFSPTSASDLARPSSRSSSRSSASLSLSDASESVTGDSVLSGSRMDAIRRSDRGHGHSPASSIGSSLMMPCKDDDEAARSRSTLAASETMGPFTFPAVKSNSASSQQATTSPTISQSPQRARNLGQGHRPSHAMHTPSLSSSSVGSSTSMSSSRSRSGMVTEHSNGKVGVLGGGVLLGVPSQSTVSTPASDYAASSPGGGVGVNVSPRKRGDRRRGRADSGAGGSFGATAYGAYPGMGVWNASQNLMWAQQQQHSGGRGY